MSIKSKKVSKKKMEYIEKIFHKINENINTDNYEKTVHVLEYALTKVGITDLTDE
jgi:hypothetical protein